MEDIFEYLLNENYNQRQEFIVSTRIYRNLELFINAYLYIYISLKKYRSK